MDRRSWLKAAGLCFAAAVLPKYEWGSEMRYGDLLAKLAKGEQLSPSEAEALRLYGNKQEDMASQVAGWSGNSGMISSGAIDYPFDVIATHKTVVDEHTISFSVPTTYNHVRLVGNYTMYNSTRGAGTVFMELNNSTTAEYGFMYHFAYSSNNGSLTDNHVYEGSTKGILVSEMSVGTTTPSVSSGTQYIDIPFYGVNTGLFKSGTADWYTRYTLDAVKYECVNNCFWWFDKAEPIHTITLHAYENSWFEGNNFAAGTNITLLGHR